MMPFKVNEYAQQDKNTLKLAYVHVNISISESEYVCAYLIDHQLTT